MSAVRRNSCVCLFRRSEMNRPVINEAFLCYIVRSVLILPPAACHTFLWFPMRGVLLRSSQLFIFLRRGELILRVGYVSRDVSSSSRAPTLHPGGSRSKTPLVSRCATTSVFFWKVGHVFTPTQHACIYTVTRKKPHKLLLYFTCESLLVFSVWVHLDKTRRRRHGFWEIFINQLENKEK